MPQVQKYISLVTEYKKELQDRAAYIHAVINQIPDERQREVLRYAIDGLTGEQTADKTGYCVRSVNRHRRAALESLKGVLDAAETPQDAPEPQGIH